MFFLAVLSLCILGVFYVRWLDVETDAETSTETVDEAQPVNDAGAQLAITPASDDAADSVEQPAIGMQGDTVPSHAQSYYDLPAGVYVNEASIAELQVGDIITALNGVSIASIEELAALKDRFVAGDAITLTIWRDGVLLEITVTLLDQDEIES